MTDVPRLIEHAFPLKQASLDSVHGKNVRHRHISTLHIWPARRGCQTTPTLTFFSFDRRTRSAPSKSRVGRERATIEVSANEWAKACNLREGYWLYAVYDCATPSPRLVRVQDPFRSLLAKAKGSVLIGSQAIFQAAEMDEAWRAVESDIRWGLK